MSPPFWVLLAAPSAPPFFCHSAGTRPLYEGTLRQQRRPSTHRDSDGSRQDDKGALYKCNVSPFCPSVGTRPLPPFFVILPEPVRSTRALYVSNVGALPTAIRTVPVRMTRGALYKCNVSPFCPSVGTRPLPPFFVILPEPVRSTGALYVGSVGPLPTAIRTVPVRMTRGALYKCNVSPFCPSVGTRPLPPFFVILSEPVRSTGALYVSNVGALPTEIRTVPVRMTRGADSPR